MTGKLNTWLEKGARAELRVRHVPGKPLILMLFWRRASELHLTSVLPLFVVYGPAALKALKAAQTRVEPLRS